MGSSFLKYNIPYDEYLYSVTSNKSDNLILCILDIQTLGGHILPALLFVLQVYPIYKLFSLTANCSHLLKNLFRVIALLIFVIIAIAAQESYTYLYFYTSYIVCSSDFCLYMVYSVFNLSQLH
jgi:hypothetical protein